MNRIVQNPGRCGARGRTESLPAFSTRSIEGRRTAFTLLEVTLALALSVLLLGALAMAIQVTLHATTAGRVDVARAQLARALVRRIADDLRGAVWYEPTEVEAPVPGTAGAAGSDDGSGGTGAAGAGPANAASAPAGSASGNDGGPQVSGDESESSSEDAESPAVTRVPGLYGGLDWLEVDVSRLPRADQYEAAAGNPDRLSDVKRVAYYYAYPGASRAAPSQATTIAGRDDASGLVRREVDRAVTQWAAENGNLAGLAQSAEVLAPEVLAIEFQYYDGAEWLTQWDSSERGGLPVAVEIAVALADAPPAGAVDAGRAGGIAAVGPDAALYRLLVHLPVSRPSEATDATAATTTGSETEGRP